MISIEPDTLARAAFGTLAVIYGGALSLTLAAMFCIAVAAFHRFNSRRTIARD